MMMMDEADGTAVDDAMSQQQQQKKKCNKSRNSLASLPTIYHILRDVLPKVVEFLHPNSSDWRNISLTNSKFRDAVETCAKGKLDQLRTDHPHRDETWEDRLCDQTDLETTRSKPVQLPCRYLLLKARKLHLYKLEISTEKNKLKINTMMNAFDYRLDLNPTQTRLFVAQAKIYPHENDPGNFQIWDLINRQCLYSFHISAHFLFNRVHYFDGFLAACSRDNLSIYNETTGELLHTYETETEEIYGSVKHGQDTVIINHRHQIISFNVQTGITNEIVRNVRIERSMIVGVYDDRWLLLNTKYAPGVGGRQRSGISVFDLQNGGKKNHFLDNFFTNGSMVKWSDGSTILFAQRSDEHMADSRRHELNRAEKIRLLKLSQEGMLSPCPVFETPGITLPSCFGNLVYHSELGSQGAKIYNAAREGQREGSLAFPTGFQITDYFACYDRFARSTVSNGQLVFVALRQRREAAEAQWGQQQNAAAKGSYIVAAYPVD